MIYRSGEFIPSLIMRIDSYKLSDDELILIYEDSEQKITFEWSYFSICDFSDMFDIDNESHWTINFNNEEN